MTEPQKTKIEVFSSFIIIACGLAVLAYMREKLLEFSSMPLEIIALAILILMGIGLIISLLSGKSGARGMPPVLRSKNPIIYWLIISAYLVFFVYCYSQRKINFKLLSRTSGQVNNSQKLTTATEQQINFQNQLKEDAVYVGQPVSSVQIRSFGNWRYIILSNNGKASITNVSQSTPISKK